MKSFFGMGAAFGAGCGIGSCLGEVLGNAITAIGASPLERLQAAQAELAQKERKQRQQEDYERECAHRARIRSMRQAMDEALALPDDAELTLEMVDRLPEPGDLDCETIAQYVELQIRREKMEACGADIGVL